MSCYPYSEGEGEKERKKKNDSSTLFLSKKSCSIIVITVLPFTKNCLHLIFYIVNLNWYGKFHHKKINFLSIRAEQRTAFKFKLFSLAFGGMVL